MLQILQKLKGKDKEEHQGDMTHFLAGASVNVMIRRNFIYEDAFEKLSPENGKYVYFYKQTVKMVIR